MRAYVLCGGLGTRLREVTKGGQKAVVDVHGEPFLLLLLRQLKTAGIGHVVLCAGYRADQLETMLADLSQGAGLSLDLVIEPHPLGTGGALLNALQQHPADAPYLVLNADTYLAHDAFRLRSDGVDSVILGVAVADRARYGSLRVADDGHVLELLEKGETGPGLVNAGVYCFTPAAMAGEQPRPCSMELDLLPSLIARCALRVVTYAGSFVDIGTPDALAAFKASSDRSAQQ
ncbi:sugar phosphate nucleotidyltransferase [Halopseudomonas sabulinigri]|uniref:Nucleotidyltransferase family protein n=1 Tax=Halopseudomonas sabulinigri TaxID=472181 RepID=A0ABP9ZMR3_9GAMM